MMHLKKVLLAAFMAIAMLSLGSVSKANMRSDTNYFEDLECCLGFAEWYQGYTSFFDDDIEVNFYFIGYGGVDHTYYTVDLGFEHSDDFIGHTIEYIDGEPSLLWYDRLGGYGEGVGPDEEWQ